MQRMGIEALYRRPRTTKPEPGHKIYPYLLRGLAITRKLVLSSKARLTHAASACAASACRNKLSDVFFNRVPRRASLGQPRPQSNLMAT